MNEEVKVAEDLGPSLTLEGRYLIYPERPLPEFSCPGGAAFVARSLSDATQDLIAIVCSKGLQPRIDMTSPMKLVDSNSALKLREAGVVHWPAQGAHYYAYVYERPLAKRFWQTLDETHPTMSEDTVTQTFVIPMIRALLEFQRTGIMHGGIRPTNIFWLQGSATPPQLGEALAQPAGVGQPAMFETIERAMCQPLGRGSGMPVDDCYAFGITLSMVIMGINPFQGMDDLTILRTKMERGSFNAVMGSHRLPTNQIELLRGLLMDDPRQRWSANDLEQWMTGRRLTPKSSDAGRRASRHFDIGGKEYWQVRPLAMGLAENVGEAVKAIESGSLNKWLTRSLGDEERSKAVTEAIEQLKEGGKTAHYQEQLVTRACIALDPAGPIRYRGVSVMPSGVATMLADAMITGSNLQIVSEIIAAQFVTLWVNMQKDTKTDLVPIAQQMERMRAIVEKTSFGGGLERAVYELNPTLPCLSPMLRNECVTSPKRLLSALERVGGTGTQPAEPMDRHIAAFLIARDKRSESLFAAMSTTERPLRRGLAMLSLFGEMQYRYGPDNCPHICNWLMPLLEPCLKRFLSKPFQDKVRRQAKEAVDKGDLSLLLKRIDDPQRVHGDEQDFLNARLMYQNISREIQTLENSLANRGHVVRDVGRPVAASLASLIGIILIALTLGRVMIRNLLG